MTEKILYEDNHTEYDLQICIVKKKTLDPCR